MIAFAISSIGGNVSLVSGASSQKPNFQNKENSIKKEYIIKTEDKSIYDFIKKSYKECNNIAYDEVTHSGYINVKLSDEEYKMLKTEKKIDFIERDNEVSVRPTDIQSSEAEHRKSTKLEKKQIHISAIRENVSNNGRAEKNKKWNYHCIHVDEDMNFNSIQKDNPDEKEMQKSKVKVAIIDSGINAGNGFDIEEQIDLVSGTIDLSPMFMDVTGHGDSIAGIIAGSEEGTVSGICPELVQLYSARVLDENNEATISRIVEGIEWAIAQDVNIINMSFGTSEDSEALHSVIRKAYGKGILLVAAAGNTGNKTDYPAAYEEVVAVGSIGIDGSISEFSANDDAVEVLAPGEMVESTGALSGTVICDGTSVSAAHVSAVAACIWSKDMTKSAEFVRSVLYAGANMTKDNVSDGGLIDYEHSMKIYNQVEESIKEKKMEYFAKKERGVSANEGTIKNFLKEIAEDVPKNDNVVESYSEAVVEASWSGHKNMASDAGANAAMQEGAYFPDSTASGLAGVEAHPLWHARRTTNAFCTYRYLVKVGNSVKSLSSNSTKNDIKNAISSVVAVTGQDAADRNQLKNDLCTDAVVNKIMSYSTGANKRSFIMGMASHVATDMYAHSAYFYDDGDGKWKKHTHSDYSTTDSRYSDNTGVSGTARRYCASKKVILNVVRRNDDKRTDIAVLRDFYDSSANTYYVNGTRSYKVIYQDFKLENCKSRISKAGMTSTEVLNAFANINY